MINNKNFFSYDYSR